MLIEAGSSKSWRRWGGRLLLTFSAASVFVFGILWWRSFHRHGDYVTFVFGGARYIIESTSGRIVVSGPPVVTAQERAAARRSLPLVGNDGILWSIRFHKEQVNDKFIVVPRSGTPSIERSDPDFQALMKLSSAARTTTLLMALENPERFAAAHILLTLQEGPQRTRRTRPQIRMSGWDGRRLNTEWGGLHATLSPTLPQPISRALSSGIGIESRKSESAEERVRSENRDSSAARAPSLQRGTTQSTVPFMAMVTCEAPDEIQIDSAQAPRIRDFWFRRLGTRLAAVPHWILVAVGALPLLMRAVLMCRRYIRVRQGQCTNCGYDLRSGHDRCPECGQAVSIKQSARRMIAR